METSERTLRLRVPATQEYLATIRLFGAAAAAHFGAGTDAAEDLRLALSESSALVMGGAGAGHVQITLAPSDDGANVQVEVRREGSSGGSEPSHEAAGDHEDAAELALALLRALVTDLTVDGGEGEGRPAALSFSFALAADDADIWAHEESTLPGPPPEV